MKISAAINNKYGEHTIVLSTNDNSQSITISPKPGGYGSSVNGGELLCLALATCYCNDIYREAAKRNLKVENIEVEVESIFGAEGEPAQNIIFSSKVTALGNKEEIEELMKYTDKVSEIQNTLRKGISVTLNNIVGISIES